jgi:hypothetical protein
MTNEPSSIKILLKYYNFSQENNIANSTNKEFKKILSKSNSNLNNINYNYRYSGSSLVSNEKKSNKTIKPINKFNDNERKTNFKTNKNISIMGELTQDYLIHFSTNFPYNSLENQYPPKVINIKTCVYLYLVDKKKLNITMDSLLLFRYNHGKYILLNDEDYFFPKISPKMKSNQSNLYNNNKNNKKDKNENNISNSTIIYYNISKEKIKVIVELYSKTIDRISMNISKKCSLLMLKYIVALKLRQIEKNKNIADLIEKNAITFNNHNNISNELINTITLDEIEQKVKIYGNGIVNKDFTEYLSKKETNRNFNNNSTILEIYNYYANNQNQHLSTINSINDNSTLSNNNLNTIKKDNDRFSKEEEGALNFILMEHKGNKCCLGLDFRFTILQYFIPVSKEDDQFDMINFKSNPKSDSYYSKSGLNLYFNCKNNECKYNNKSFILNVGYGCYDIFNLIKFNAYCPFCNKSKQEFIENNRKNNYNNNNALDLTNIGMMNSKWAYKGYLHGIKMTIVEGKGMTVKNDILYKTKEFNFLHQFKKLTFQIENYTSSNEYNIINSKNSQNSSYYSEDINVINEIKENNEINDISNNINEENLKKDENLNIKNIEEKYASEISNEIIINETSVNKNTNIFTNKNSTINDNFILNKENEKNKLLKKDLNNNNINSNLTDNNFDKTNIEKNNNNCNNSTYFKINEYNNNVKNMINYNFNNNNTNTNSNNTNNNNNIMKKIKVKQNINNKRFSKNPKAVYYGNARQYIQNVEGNDTNNTNIDLNIVIDKQKSNCCDNCIDYQQATQVCFIF